MNTFKNTSNPSNSTHSNSNDLPPRACEKRNYQRVCSSYCSAVLSFVLLTGALLTSNPALAITGGERSKIPWVVQTFGIDADMEHSFCSGVAINQLMVITADHCVAQLVVFPNESGAATQYLQASAIEAHSIPKTDLQILVLDKPIPLAEYPKLAPNYWDPVNSIIIPAGTRGKLYGYGDVLHDNQKSLTVRVHHGQSRSRPEAFILDALNGAIGSGDSGGPLIINGMLMGVTAGDFMLDDGTVLIQVEGLSAALSTISELQHSRAMRSPPENSTALPWISDVKIENNAVKFTMASALLDSGQQIVVWVNGGYLGEVNSKDSYYYAFKEDINGGAIFRMGGYQVHDTDIVQIGIVTGANNPKSAKLLYEKVPDGLENVSINGGQLAIKMTTKLINSGHKIGIWVNGGYAGEVRNNVAYYLYREEVAGGTIFKRGGVQYGDLVQIGVVTDVNSPAASTLLYSGRPSGIKEVVRNGRRFDVHMTPDMLNAPLRLVIWVNGVYSSELYKGVVHNGATQPYLVGNLVRFPSAILQGLTGTPLVQVGIVPGVPGQSVGTPKTANLLYSGNPDHRD